MYRMDGLYGEYTKLLKMIRKREDKDGWGGGGDQGQEGEGGSGAGGGGGVIRGGRVNDKDNCCLTRRILQLKRRKLVGKYSHCYIHMSV